MQAERLKTYFELNTDLGKKPDGHIFKEVSTDSLNTSIYGKTMENVGEKKQSILHEVERSV